MIDDFRGRILDYYFLKPISDFRDTPQIISFWTWGRAMLTI